MSLFLRRASLLVLILTVTLASAQKRQPKSQSPANAAPSQPIKISLDATHAPEKILHAQLQIPVSAGAVKLVFPKWIPGEHGPTGPIADLTGVKFFANGQRLIWHRNLDEMYEFDLNVPQGVTTLEATLDLVLPAPPEGFSSGASATTQLDMVSWNQVVLYPLGPKTDDIPIVASLKLPAGWKYGTPLPVASESGGQINFEQVSLTTLVDSPVLAGAHFRRIPLSEGPIAHYIDEVADGEAALDMPQATIDAYKRLVAETGALFQSRHYRDYHFLLTLSDHTAHFGLEHHESSDDRVGERTMIDDDARWLAGSLLPHEMTHSWNGKYRRPAGLATSDYQKPMEGDLLWVYEGMTDYWGNILAARAGLWNKQQFLDETADLSAALDHTPGRSWRPLQDTADAAQILYGAPAEFESWRRSVDYYPEGFLIWLEADTVIRQQTHGQKSLNDFCKLFHGLGGNTQPKVITYTFDDIVKTLNDVTPYDWRKFLRDRLDTYGPGAPLGGVTNGGWKLVYDENPSDFTKATEKVRNFVDARYSIGLALDDKGGIHDVIYDSLAWKAGIAPGSVLAAVNGRKFTPDILHDALKEGKGKGRNLELLVINGDYYKSYTLNYHDGEKYPHLVRDESKPDVLSDIIKPIAK